MASVIRQLIPRPLKEAARFIRYKNQRKKIVREPRIKKQQDKLLRQNFNTDAKKLIVFLTMGADWETGTDKISGGAISIVSLCEETGRLKSQLNAEVILCTMPGQHLLLKHTQFPNDIDVFRFEQVEKYFHNLNEIVLHLPEWMAEVFLKYVIKKKLQWLKGIENVHINIMNQNVHLMPDKSVMNALENISNTFTITTAHKKYCTENWRKQYGIPLHHFSTFTSPEKYDFINYSYKEDLVLFSPDDTIKNKEIIDLLGKKLPHIRTKVISGIKYDEYKKLIGKAKWCITFGEGLDFYFIESAFSGSISFALYNQDFFTPPFKELETVYTSYEQLKNKIIDELVYLNNENRYKEYNKKEFDLCADLYSYQHYQANIASFYKAEYTFP